VTTDVVWAILTVVLGVMLLLQERAHRADAARLEQLRHDEAIEWRLERNSLLDRVQSGDITQYHALQAAYVREQEEPEIRDYNHDDFGFVSDERSPSRED